MQLSFRKSLFTALVLMSPSWLCAQQTADPSGHWEGALQTPDRSVNIEVDLAKNANGELAGTIGIPEQNLKGIPFQKVSMDGQSLTFQARSDQAFTGTLSPDGKSLTGNLSVSGFAVPVSLTRTGGPRIAPPEKSAPIRKELEGTWNGALSAEGKQLHLILTMSNQPDGTASGSALAVDEGGLVLPMTIAQADSNVVLQFKAVGASFTGTLNKEATELAGTYKQGSLVLPLTFQHAASQGKN